MARKEPKIPNREVVTAGRVWWSSYAGRPITVYVRRDLKGTPGVYAIGVAYESTRLSPAVVRIKRRFAERVDSRAVPDEMIVVIRRELDKLPARKPAAKKSAIRSAPKPKKPSARAPRKRDTAAALSKAREDLQQLFEEPEPDGYAAMSDAERHEIAAEWQKRHDSITARIRRAEKAHAARKDNPVKKPPKRRKNPAASESTQCAHRIARYLRGDRGYTYSQADRAVEHLVSNPTKISAAAVDDLTHAIRNKKPGASRVLVARDARAIVSNRAPNPTKKKTSKRRKNGGD